MLLYRHLWEQLYYVIGPNGMTVSGGLQGNTDSTVWLE